MVGHVAVSIVGFRNAGEVLACLEALSRSTYNDFEVVICENGGAEAFWALNACLPAQLADGQKVRAFALNDNPGFAAGVNACLRATPDADMWWILNPDTCPEPEALAHQVTRIGLGDVQAVGSVLYGRDGIVQCYGGHWNGALSRTEMIGSGQPLEAPVPVKAVEARMSYIIGASMLVDRRFVDTAGFMKEDYFLYCEEVEWCLRAQSRGLRLGLAPRSRVLHLQGTTTGASTNPKERSWLNVHLNERNKLLLVLDTDPWKAVLAVPFSLILVFARYGRHLAWKQLWFGLSGWMAALRGERGKPMRLSRAPGSEA